MASRLGRPAALAALGIIILIFVAGLAVFLARSGQEAPATLVPATAPAADAGMQVMLERLRARLAAAPEDAEGWLLLARSCRDTHDPACADDAYQRAAALDPRNADLLVEHAHALGMAQGNDLSGAPAQLLERALDIDGDNASALALAGEAAAQAGRRTEALRHWRHLESLQPEDAPGLGELRALIARTAGRDPAAEDGLAIRGILEFPPAGAAGSTAFVYARAEDGPALPVAVLRLEAADQPQPFRLDDSHAMLPEMHLWQFDRFEVCARLSRSGSLRDGERREGETCLPGIRLGAENLHLQPQLAPAG